MTTERVKFKVLINEQVVETMGGTLTRDGDSQRLAFDKPIHVEDGESFRILEIDEVPDGD